MSALTKKPLTNTVQLSFTVPLPLVEKVRDFMQQVGAEEEKEHYTIEEVFPYAEEEKPRVYLRGIRTREDLTQKELSERTGIPIRHISEMENGKRPIGKKNAAKLAEVLNCNARSLVTL